VNCQVPERVETMARWVERQRRRTYEVVEMFGQLMSAVAFLHRHGVSTGIFEFLKTLLCEHIRLSGM
jgi:hypothetical protein